MLLKSRIIIFLSFFSVYLYGQSESMTENITYYGGLNSGSILSEDFSDFHISDWVRFGLGGAEGRVAMPLSEKDPEGANAGILLGAIVPVNDRMNGFAEVQAGLGETTMIGLYAGVTYNVINGEKFKLGLSPKIGYTGGVADFGELELIDGYTAPVIIDEGTFTNGDKISMDLSGFGVQIGLTPSFQLSEKLGLFFQAGYELSFSSDPVIKVEPAGGGDAIEIDMESSAIVKTDGSSTQAGISPSAYTGGTILQFGISFKM